MSIPIALLIASLCGVAAAFSLPGWSDLILLAGPCAVASAVLLLKRRKPAPQWIVLDGSNVMYWKDGTPQIETVQEAVRHLSALGFSPGVVFDANAGYLLAGKYRHDQDFGRLLGLPDARVMVVPKGTPADPAILTAARELGARVVTNDRYRDWVDDHPEISGPGFLIRGGYRSGQLWMDIGQPGNAEPEPAGASARARADPARQA